MLDVDAWLDQAAREIAESDVFQLFLAKLLEVGHDHDGKALKGIARLLATDSQKLHKVLDRETFEAILCSLDNRLPVDVRSQATLATAKYLEASPSEGQKLLLDFIQTRIARQRNEDLITAFSAAAAVFPLVPSIASSFFLFEGFVPSLAPLLQRKIKSEEAEYAALEMLSAAWCVLPPSCYHCHNFTFIVRPALLHMSYFVDSPNSSILIEWGYILTGGK